MIVRIVVLGVLFATFLAGGVPAGAQPAPTTPPLSYEVQINGESFVVEANRVVTVESKKQPGSRYTVAVRLSPAQTVSLGSFQFDYQLPAKVEENGKPGNRSVRLTHELGFSILLGDLGPTLPPKDQEATLKILTDSVTAALRESKDTAIDVSVPHTRNFDGSAARGLTIRYRDGKNFDHVCLVYVLTGPTFAASCVVEYLEHDSDDVLPLIKKTLDSVRARTKN
jgi:hypothetical protein